MTNTLLWERYTQGKSYQATMGFVTSFPLCVDFKEGRQWPVPTKATKSLPRPVFNICEKFVRTKKSNILNQQIKMVFSPAETAKAADIIEATAEEKAATFYSEFASSLWKEIRQDELNDECVDDAATLGTGILHYYWDDDVSGGVKYPYKGALRGEVLDPLTVIFGNPQETDVQRQPYILIATRVLVSEVKRMARNEGLSEDKVQLITPDEETPDTYVASQVGDNTKKCTLITMYYRDGGVRYTRGTKGVNIIEGRSLTPGIADKRDDEEREYENAIDLYPIAVMTWQRRKRSIYGLGEVENIIPSQKAINWLMAMNILSAQDTAWPKMIIKPNALRQEVTNTPGEIITDYTPNGRGVDYMQSPGISSGAMVLVDKLNELMQYTSGVSEVVSGEPFTATMAASAIIALQNQAKQPIENIQKRFYRVIEDVGRIWEAFFKFYYTAPRPIVMELPDGTDGTIAFVGSDFAHLEFKLDIDVGAGSEYSESLAQATLDKLFDANQIDLDTYIELCPKNVMPFKEQLKRRVEERRQREGTPMQTAPMSEEVGGNAPLGIPLPEVR